MFTGLANSELVADNLCRKHQKEFKDQEMAVDLTDKQCLVTGANTGIGYASAEALAARYIVYTNMCAILLDSQQTMSALALTIFFPT